MILYLFSWFTVRNVKMTSVYLGYCRWQDWIESFFGDLTLLNGNREGGSPGTTEVIAIQGSRQQEATIQQLVLH